jgi:predicted alpha/beta-fold hydrolase
VTTFRPLFRNPHWQTIAGHFWPRPGVSEANWQRRFFRTEPDVEVLVESLYPPATPRGALVMLHGLEGSSRSGYVQSLAASAVAQGFAAHGFNMRTCGGTEQLCSTLYHAGLTSDLRSVVQELRAESDAPLFLVGFSLGGNVVVKLAGEWGAEGPRWIHGVCGVSTPLYLEACSRSIAEPQNAVYERRFVRRMRTRLCATGRYQPSDFAGLRSVIEIDDRITAPSFDFGGAHNYYATQSSLGFLHAIRVPVMLIQAKDDTFIPFEIYGSGAVRANPLIEVLVTDHGGHLGFIGRKPSRFWADEAIMNWVSEKVTPSTKLQPLCSRSAE